MKKALALIIASLMALALTACAGSPGVSGTPSASPSEQASVSVGLLKGPTGIGASYLMEQSSKGATALNYTFTTESDPSNITSAIISGSLDLAAVPTNVAAVLYNQTKGNIKIVAINTLSVLYILEKGNTIKSVSDLKGKTIYATGQGANPEYVLNYILEQNGLKPGVDVNIEFMDSSQLATEMAAGTIDIAMLPVPNSTTVLMKNANVRVAMNLGDEWKTVTGGDSVLTQGCIVARMDAPNIEAIIPQFLNDYKASIDYMSNETNLDAASQLAFKYEIVGSAAIAKAAIPQCNLAYITGLSDMKNALSGYFDVLFKASPKSVGGKLPDDNFYYGG